MSGADVQRLLEEQAAAIQLTDERAEQLWVPFNIHGLFVGMS